MVPAVSCFNIILWFSTTFTPFYFISKVYICLHLTFSSIVYSKNVELSRSLHEVPRDHLLFEEHVFFFLVSFWCR